MLGKNSTGQLENMISNANMLDIFLTTIAILANILFLFFTLPPMYDTSTVYMHDEVLYDKALHESATSYKTTGQKTLVI